MAIQFLHDVDINGNLDLKNNQLQNAKLQQLATNPGTVVEGMIFQNTTSDVVIVGLNGSWVPLTSADGDITGVTAGDGLTGGGSTGAVTLNVVGGAGITASADEISLTAGLIADGSNITSLGNLSALAVDNITINGNTIFSLTNDLIINVTDGQSAVIEGVAIDDGVVTGASSITSTAFVGNVTGAVTGNADTATLAADATTLATPRAINGEDFDGSAAITVTAAAGTLSGTTLKSTVVTSSLTSVGALNSGSITSGFGTIDNGASAITTTGLISGGSLDIDSVLINGTTIGHTDDTDLITLADGQVTITGGLTVTGTTTTNNVETVSTSSGVIFEGAAADGHDATLISAVSGADVTYTLPNATGTIALTSDIDGTNSGTNSGDEPDASITVKGIVELATTVEALAGTDTARAVTPAGLAARGYSQSIGNGSATSFTITHNLGTRSLLVQMIENQGWKDVYASIARPTVNTITVEFTTAPTLNDIQVFISKI